MAHHGVKDVYEGMTGYVGATHWSKPYFSNHHHENPPDNTQMLAHVNCGYLSTPGRPPTLEALKQHAQSLTYLISTLAPSQIGAEVDNENTTREGFGLWQRQFPQHEAFDWLNNLQRPYDNIDKAHRKPLNSLANLVKRNSDEKGVEFHCPMDETPIHLIESNPDLKVHPFQTHMTLLMHANECLERLDHEYSAMGGLLSILPTDRDDTTEHPNLEKAKQTLVGQWLLFTQHLLSRMHELEIAYANSLDLLANEAVVPAQHMSTHGPDGRSGREIVFPQDRWILANAGEDVYTFIHNLLDKKESFLNEQEGRWIKQDVVGDRMDLDQWGFKQSTLKGIAHIDLSTRFYRLKGSGHGPIFVLPAFADRPNTKYTMEMENRPTVVTLPTPSFTQSTSAFDKRMKDLQAAHSSQNVRLGELMRDNTNLKATNEARESEVKNLRHVNQLFETNLGKDVTEMTKRLATAEKEQKEAHAQYEECAEERNQLKREIQAYKNRVGDDYTNRTELPWVHQEPDGRYTVNKSQLESYEARSKVVDHVKPDIERSKSVLESLAAQGHLNLHDFDWIDRIAHVA
ncbi:hypothetical protein GGR54DRAFT_568741 [Hypoxylon sp. NC1633]|nr:hypothetical protein GGR54DRAFT_568741 [Hypoxylon sp. NC1633]